MAEGIAIFQSQTGRHEFLRKFCYQMRGEHSKRFATVIASKPIVDAQRFGERLHRLAGYLIIESIEQPIVILREKAIADPFA
jgi:hypothetical protein